ncbi:hypothetical protein AQUCO_09300007v1 [Aquilegia coerulea]|uniref:Uncharacterized protein n=1 Tax=Aquilegia coerulea TaxID=218851 RepID=A0A2G5C534_AQUCA|nr:hypothetical protein AQUCO_09300007v1 [Aquilegia coerulea]PIA26413.1 hypothetical protein AQUCO_09300007v1 [Aquilegia coerulea]
MHSRHRNTGGAGGFRSNTLGMGGLAASRISPDTSLPRNFSAAAAAGYNRSFSGRMLPNNNNSNNNKPYVSTHPLPPRRADILMEAGRLATEYLVSQGVLPPIVLSDKWSKNAIMEFQLATDSKTSALARLGNGVPEPSGLRNQIRARRRMGSDWGRDNKKNGFFPDKAPNTSADISLETDQPLVSGQWNHDERRPAPFINDAIANNLPSKTEILVGDSESEIRNFEEYPDDSSLKAITSTTGGELPSETDPKPSNASDEVNISNMETDETKISNIETGEMNNSTSIDVLENQSDLDDPSMLHQPMETDVITKNGSDLLRHCSFAKVPTKTRSSLTIKGSKVETVLMTGELGNTCDIPSPEGPKISGEEDPSVSLSNFMLVNPNQYSKCSDSDAFRAPSIQAVEDAGVLGSALALEKGECATSLSLLDRPAVYEQAPGQGLSELPRCNSVVKDRGDKRALEADDVTEGSKKLREWPSSTDEFFHLHTFTTPSHSHMRTAPDVEVIEVDDQDRLFDVSFLPRGGSESGIESKEEKQLFPSSFKICDLNLMESSDMTETRDSAAVYGLPSTMEAKEGVQVDVGLSISNSCSRSDDYNRSTVDAKEVEIVEVEDDATKEGEDFDTSERKTEIQHSSLENFPNHMDTGGDLPDTQEGYGLMISELLGNDISNCSSVPGDISSLHTEMGLHNGAEILDDDDPIYLSLGEIPISMPDI